MTFCHVCALVADLTLLLVWHREQSYFATTAIPSRSSRADTPYAARLTHPAGLVLYRSPGSADRHNRGVQKGRRGSRCAHVSVSGLDRLRNSVNLQHLDKQHCAGLLLSASVMRQLCLYSARSTTSAS